MKNMLKIQLILPVIFILIYSLSSFSQIIPSWCEKVDYDKDYIAHENYRTEGVSYLLSDVQVNFITQEIYTRLSVKITEGNGLQQVSSLVINYDSTYQTAVFLTINIIRNGQVINVLKKQKPELIRREKNLEFGIIDGSVTTYLEVNDLRVGDILDYSYVLKGFNPIVKNFIQFNQYTSYPVPIGKIHICFVTGISDDYIYHLKNGAPNPVIKKTKNITKYNWDIYNPNVTNFEQDIPSWYDPIPLIQFSTNTTWENLTNHILTLFTSIESFNDEYKALLKTITDKYSAKDERARFAIKYVQNNIHYLGNENGIYSFKPRHPNTILQKKSGDCKEKSWLLTCLLNDIGYEAYPVLVNTVQGHILEELPISLGAFNHCVICLITGSDTIFIDPTIANQGGNLQNLSFPNYEKGLILKKGTSDLITIPIQNEGKTTIEETFRSDEFKGITYLDVKTVIEGGSADFQRTLLKNVSLKDIQTGYLKFYANIYSRIDTVRIFSFEDDIDKNEIIVKQSYSIYNFWNVTDTLNPENLTAKFQAQTIHNLLLREVYSERKSPVALIYPLNITQTIIANLPLDWGIKNETETINGDGFNFTRTVNYDNQKLRLEYNYTTTKPYIESTKYYEFIDKNAIVINRLNYALWYNTSDNIEKTKERPHPFFIILIALIIGFLIMAAFHAFKYDPIVDIKYTNSNQSIGGWLLIPGIGIVALTVFMLVFFVLKIDWGINSWLFPSTSDNQTLNLLYRFLLLFGYLFFSIFGVLNSILLILKRSSFPKLMILYSIIFALFTLQFSIIVFLNTKEIPVFFMNLYPIINCLIWIPYFRKSERVKRTFTRRLKTDNIKYKDVVNTDI